MLNLMRKATGNIFIKLLLIMVALAFVATGINGVFSAKTNNIATFKYCKPITRQELAYKINEQKKLIANLNEQGIDNVQLAQLVLSAIIEQRLFDFFAERIKMSISPQALAKVVQESQSLQTDDGVFDRAKFEAFLAKIGISEQRYFEIISSNIATNLIGDTFDNSNYQSSLLLNSLKSFFAEERKASVLSVDLNKLAVSLQSKCSEEELQSFFKTEAEKFRVPEKRDLKYLVFDAQFFQSRQGAKTPVDEVKLQQLILEYEKILEEEVAAGLSLEEIAAKFAVKPVILHDLSLQHALTINDVIKDFAIEAFQAPIDELSYPLIINNERILLVQTNKIIQSFIPDFADARAQVLNDYAKLLAKEQALKMLNELPKDIKFQDLKEWAQKHNFDIKTGLMFAKAFNDAAFPMPLLELIFSTNQKVLTKAYADDESAYVALVDEVKVNAQRKKMLDNSNITYQIRQSYAQELLDFLRKINEVEVNYDDPIFSN